MHFIKCGYNGLLIGRHGTGKTGVIKEAFTEIFGKLGEDWLYFSASTIDPWVDFIGIPREITDENGNKYLDFVRPKSFISDKVQGIFLDEYNRSHKKIRNATMELIQFKSINGKKFPNLKVVWAAINPPEEDDDQESTYSVERLDPAQEDRFEVQIRVPYDVDDEYFINKYGKKIGSGACHFWRQLPDKSKEKVSPRRLEFAINAIQNGLNIKDFILPGSVSPAQLIKYVKEGSPRSTLDNLISSDSDGSKIKEFFNNPNNFDAVKADLKTDMALATKTLQYISQEYINVLINESNKLEKLIFNDKPELFVSTLESIVTYSKQATLKNKAVKALSKVEQLIKKVPKDLSKLNNSGSVSKRTSELVESCVANDLTIDTHAMINDNKNINTNSTPDAALVMAIKTAQDEIANSSSTFKRNSALDNILNCNLSCITKEIAFGLLGVLDIYSSRSQQGASIYNTAYINILHYAIIVLCIENYTSESIIELLKKDYQNIFVKYLSYVAENKDNGSGEGECVKKIMERLHLQKK